MRPEGSRVSRDSRVSRISVVPFFGELTNGKFVGKRQNKYNVNPVNPVNPVKFHGALRQGDRDQLRLPLPEAQEASPPLPPDVRHVCPSLSFDFLVPTPSWVMKALWEGVEAQGRPQGGPLAAQGARR